VRQRFRGQPRRQLAIKNDAVSDLEASSGVMTKFSDIEIGHCFLVSVSGGFVLDIYSFRKLFARGHNDAVLLGIPKDTAEEEFMIPSFSDMMNDMSQVAHLYQSGDGRFEHPPRGRGRSSQKDCPCHNQYCHCPDAL
jgi:hypothetical protein